MRDDFFAPGYIHLGDHHCPVVSRTMNAHPFFSRTQTLQHNPQSGQLRLSLNSEVRYATIKIG